MTALFSPYTLAGQTLLDVGVDINRQHNIDGQDTDSRNIEFDTRVSHYQSLGQNSSIAIYGGLYSKNQSIDNDANYWQAKTGVLFSRRLSQGFNQTTLVAAANYRYRDYTNDVYQQTHISESRLGLNTRLTDKISVAGRYVHRHFEDMYPEFVALHWQSIDSHDNELQLKLNYQNDNITWRAEQRYTEGDRFIAAPYGNQQQQLRLWPDSTIHTSIAGLHYALTNHSALDLQANYYRTAFKSRNYYSHGISLAYLYRFEL